MRRLKTLVLLPLVASTLFLAACRDEQQAGGGGAPQMPPSQVAS